MNALVPTKQKEYVYHFSLSTDREPEPDAQAAINLLVAGGIMKVMTEPEFWAIRGQLEDAGVLMQAVTRVPMDPEPV